MQSVLLSSLALAGAVLAVPAVEKRALPVGQLIQSCTVPGTVAMTFDDGPYEYTSKALELLADAGMKATFFLNGANWGSIYDYGSIVNQMRAEGHQVGSHTWSHADLGTSDVATITSQMTQLETALVSIMGVRPTYVRCPYLSYSTTSLNTLGSLGYHVIDIDVDTLDWNLQNNIPAAQANFENGLDAGGSITLSHDVHQNTVEQLLPLMIQAIEARGLTAVTVGECLGDPAANWYAAARGSTTTSTRSSTTSTRSSTTSTRSSTTTTSTRPATTTTTSTRPTTTTTSTRPTTTTTSTRPTTTTTSTRPTTTTTSTRPTTTSTTSTNRPTTRTTTTTIPTTTTTRTTSTTTSTSTRAGTTTTTTSTRPATTTTTRVSTTTTSTRTSTTTTAATGYPVSTDWTCGAEFGTRCPDSNCCSQYGWCGTSNAYCRAGCQKGFGKCK